MEKTVTYNALVCDYCGEENTKTKFIVKKCPVCGLDFCPMCEATIDYRDYIISICGKHVTDLMPEGFNATL